MPTLRVVLDPNIRDLAKNPEFIEKLQQVFDNAFECNIWSPRVHWPGVGWIKFIRRPDGKFTGFREISKNPRGG